MDMPDLFRFNHVGELERRLIRLFKVHSRHSDATFLLLWLGLWVFSVCHSSPHYRSAGQEAIWAAGWEGKHRDPETEVVLPRACKLEDASESVLTLLEEMSHNKSQHDEEAKWEFPNALLDAVVIVCTCKRPSSVTGIYYCHNYFAFWKIFLCPEVTLNCCSDLWKGGHWK